MTRVSQWLASEPIQGMFWNAATPDRRVPGVLTLADMRPPEIALWDSLDPIPAAKSYSIPVRQTINVVIGQTNMGEVTLLEGTSDHFGANLGRGTWSGHLAARAAYLGEAYAPDQIEHDRFSVFLDGLDLLVPFRFAKEDHRRPRFSFTVDVTGGRREARRTHGDSRHGSDHAGVETGRIRPVPPVTRDRRHD